MNALRRGVRNAFRNSIRSVGVVLILAVAIALAISMLIARDAVNTKIASVRASTGTTITVTPQGSFGFQSNGKTLTNADVTKVENLDHVTSVKASLQERVSSSDTSLQSSISFQGGFGGGGFGAQSSNTTGTTGSTTTTSLPVTFTGTNSPGDALTGGAVGGGTEKLTSGTSFAATSKADVAIVGKALASKNDLKVGSTFTAWGKTIKVVGIYDAGTTFANNGVIMPLASVQTLADAAGEVSTITVVADSVDNVSSVTKAIETTLGSSASVTSEQATAEAQLAPLNSVKTISTYTLIGAIIAAGLILLLSMLMIVRERRREIGVLKAIGAPNRSVIGQFVAESTTFTVLGSVVGLIFGILLASPITNALISSNSSSTSSTGSRFGGFAGGFPGGGSRFGGTHTFTPPSGGGGFRPGNFGHTLSSTLTQVHASAGIGTLVFAFVAAIIIAAIGSTVAVSTIVRIRPAEVLRSE